MRKSPFLAAVLFAAAMAAIPAQAQDKKEAAVKPPESPSKVLLDTWNDIGRKLIAMAEDFPEDKYDFKPTPAQRTFADQLLHAAGANYFFINPAMGKAAPKEEDPKRADYKSKADIVAFVKKSFADGSAVIKAKGDKGMSDLLVDPFAHQQMRIYDMAYGFIEHSGEHYGQLVGYYRMAGLVPPESRPKK
jgi:uncharacterized damage-inducible protein DinB